MTHSEEDAGMLGGNMKVAASPGLRGDHWAMVWRGSRRYRGMLGMLEEVLRLEMQSWVRGLPLQGPSGVPQVYPCVRETQRKG